ncbi:MAG: hypothetical protein ACOCXQ_03180 [Patescibacteria group bacterium]
MNMQRFITKKPIQLAFITFLLMVILGIIAGIIDIIIFQNRVSTDFSGSVATLIIGLLYAQKYNEIMPHKLRVQVVIFFILMQSLIGLLLLSLLSDSSLTWNGFVIGVTILATVIYALSYYFFFWFGGKIIIWRSKKSNTRKDASKEKEELDNDEARETRDSMQEKIKSENGKDKKRKRSKQ